MLVLNPTATEGTAQPVELSQALLERARAITATEQCSTLDELSGTLHAVDPAEIEGDAARLAFWVNLYNALVHHELCRRPRSGNLLLHRRLFRAVGYRVGDDEYSADLIEHGVLRRNRRPPLGARRLLRSPDPRLAALPGEVDARIHFALNCGARSCPPIRSYGAGEVEHQLELATRSYVSEETTIDRAAGRITLPKLLRIYRADFGPKAAQIEFVASHVEAEDGAWVRDKRDELRVGYGSYDWTIAPDA